MDGKKTNTEWLIHQIEIILTINFERNTGYNSWCKIPYTLRYAMSMLTYIFSERVPTGNLIHRLTELWILDMNYTIFYLMLQKVICTQVRKYSKIRQPTCVKCGHQMRLCVRENGWYCNNVLKHEETVYQENCSRAYYSGITQYDQAKAPMP